MTLHFATLFDKNYLSKGLALYQSMVRHIGDFRLYILCLDEETMKYFLDAGIEKIKPIPLSDLEQDDRALASAKANRKKVEYYFTLSPILPLYVIKHFPEIEFLTTLDADVYFFGDPRSLYKEFDGKSVLITPHRFGPVARDKFEKYGKYNVSYQVFRNDRAALDCLRWWRERCIEWCYDHLDGNRYADQKYLDEWPSRFERVGVISHPGAALAPWNTDIHAITKAAGAPQSNNAPLIFYHFHGLKYVGKNLFTHSIDAYGGVMTRGLKDIVYHPYLDCLLDIQEKLNSDRPDHFVRFPGRSKVVSVMKDFQVLFHIRHVLTLRLNMKHILRSAARLRNKAKGMLATKV